MTKKTFKNELGRLKAEQKLKTPLPIPLLGNIQVSFPTQMAYVQSYIPTAIILKLCSTPFSTASTDLKFLKVIFLASNGICKKIEVFSIMCKNEMANIFPFQSMKKFSHLKYEKFRLQICLEFYISLIKNKFLAAS